MQCLHLFLSLCSFVTMVISLAPYYPWLPQQRYYLPHQQAQLPWYRQLPFSRTNNFDVQARSPESIEPRHRPQVPIVLPPGNIAPYFTASTAGEVIYHTNCQYLAPDEHTVMYEVRDPVQCGGVLCAADPSCTHFNWLGDEQDGHLLAGLCLLKKNPSVHPESFSPFSLPTRAVCGYFKSRMARNETVEPPTGASWSQPDVDSLWKSTPPEPPGVSIKLCEDATLAEADNGNYLVESASKGTFTVDMTKPGRDVCRLRLTTASSTNNELSLSCTSSTGEIPKFGVFLADRYYRGITPGKTYTRKNNMVVTVYPLKDEAIVTCTWNANP